MNARRFLAVVALILAVLSLVPFGAFPLLPVAVILLAVASLL